MKILTVGDSWSSAIEADTKHDGGWAEIIGIEDRQAISGSTAEEWANNKSGILDKAINAEADVVILSLLGNDFRKAIKDGNISIAEINACYQDMRKVVSLVKKNRTIVLLYADPYCGKNTMASFGVGLINYTIAKACHGLGVEFFKTSDVLKDEHFDGTDIHPTRAGHEALAKAIKGIL